jgi:hypothetical protein
VVYRSRGVASSSSAAVLLEELLLGRVCEE